MKTNKKLLSVLLAVLMLTGVLSVAFSAAAAGISNITLTCPAPAVGGAFPTKTDVTSNASLVIQGVFVKEMNGETAVDATAPFKSGKTYQITFVVATPSPSITFSFGLNASVNGKSCEATRLDSANANVIWNVTLSNPEEYTLTVNVEPVGAGTVTGAGTYTAGANATVIATPNSGWYFAGIYSSLGLVENDAISVFTVQENLNYTVRFVRADSTVELHKTAVGLQDGDYYFDFAQYAAEWEDDEGLNITEEYCRSMYAPYSFAYNPQIGEIYLIATDPDDCSQVINDEINYYESFAGCIKQYQEQDYTITVISQPEYALRSYELHELSDGTSRIYAYGNTGFDFIGFYEGETLLCSDWLYNFTPTHDMTIIAKYSEFKGTRVPMNTAGLNEGDSYFNLDEFANDMVKKQGGTPELWKARMNQGELYRRGFSLLFKNTDPTFMEVGDHYGGYGSELYLLLAPYIHLYIDWNAFVKLKIAGIDTVNVGDWYFDLAGYVKEIYTISGENWDTLSAEEQQSRYSQIEQEFVSYYKELWYRESRKTVFVIISYGEDQEETFLYEDQISGDDAEMMRAFFHNVKYKAPTYTVTAKAEAGGSVSGGGTFEQGATVTVKATPNSGYRFTGWYKGNSKVSGSATYSFKATENVTLTAKFEKDAAPSGGDNQNANRCHWCGKTHEGFFQKIIGFFHNIMAKIFGNKY